jgi:hypothetical protein
MTDENIEQLTDLLDTIGAEFSCAAELVTKFNDDDYHTIKIENKVDEDDHSNVDNLINYNNPVEYTDEDITIVNLDTTVNGLGDFSKNCIDSDILLSEGCEEPIRDENLCGKYVPDVDQNINSKLNEYNIQNKQNVSNFELFDSVRESFFKKVPIEDYNKNEVLQVVIGNNIWATIKPNNSINTNSIEVNSTVIFFGTIDEKTLVKTPQFFVNIELDSIYNKATMLEGQFFVDINNFPNQKSYGIDYEYLVSIIHHIGAYNDCLQINEDLNYYNISNIRFYDSQTCDANAKSMFLMFQLEYECIKQFSDVVFSQKDFEMKTMLMDYTVSTMNKLVCSQLFQGGGWVIIQPILFLIWNNIIKEFKDLQNKQI